MLELLWTRSRAWRESDEWRAMPPALQQVRMHRTGLEVPVQHQAMFCQFLVRPRAGRFEVDEAPGRHGLGARLQGGLEKRPIEWRVQQHQVQAGGCGLLQCRHAITPLHAHGAGLHEERRGQERLPLSGVRFTITPEGLADERPQLEKMGSWSLLKPIE